MMKPSCCGVALVLVIFSFFPLLFCGCERQEQQEADAVSHDPQQEVFKTQQQISVLFFSDTQADPETGDYSSFGELLALALTHQEAPDLVIFGGDTVNDGGDADEWREFWEAAMPLTCLTTAAVPGNHDNNTLLARQFDYPIKEPASQGEGFFYSISQGPVHFIMLDSNTMGAANDRDIAWLRDDLGSTEARQAVWRVAVIHHPMWLISDNPKDAARAETMREFFLPLLEEYGVDLILCGHQHVYARSLPMSGDLAPEDGSGIVQIMAASGGKGPYAAGNSEHVLASADVPVYLHLAADDESLTITTYNASGEPVDYYAAMGR